MNRTLGEMTDIPPKAATLLRMTRIHALAKLDPPRSSKVRDALGYEIDTLTPDQARADFVQAYLDGRIADVCGMAWSHVVAQCAVIPDEARIT